VNAFVLVAFPASGFVTVMFQRPVLAPLAIVMLTLSRVALTYDVEVTVIPAFENVATAPETKPVPLTLNV
jgi:hypothetical protein